MFGKMGDVIKMQREMKRIQKELQSIEIESVSGGGKVKVALNGEMKINKIDINEEVLSPENKTDLEDALQETINEGMKKAQAEAAQKTKGLMGNLDLPI